jgi:hypothetical protein
MKATMAREQEIAISMMGTNESMGQKRKGNQEIPGSH